MHTTQMVVATSCCLTSMSFTQENGRNSTALFDRLKDAN
jgi:hypothetical protein